MNLYNRIFLAKSDFFSENDDVSPNRQITDTFPKKKNFIGQKHTLNITLQFVVALLSKF